MTKEKFMFELIDQCMYIACLDNIIVENFELKDDAEFYEKIEEQFFSCITFYEEMDDLYCNGEITEQEMDEDLKEVLALMRQDVLTKLFNDFGTYLEATKLSEEKRNEGLQKLKSELFMKTIDTEFLLSKIQDFRKSEKENSVTFR